MFGVATHWITKQDAVRISDLERTVPPQLEMERAFYR
jgi:hypothetical protein